MQMVGGLKIILVKPGFEEEFETLFEEGREENDEARAQRHLPMA